MSVSFFFFFFALLGVAEAQRPFIEVNNVQSDGFVRVDGPNQVARLTVAWGNDSGDTLSHVQMTCAIDDPLAEFTEGGRADLLTEWSYSDSNQRKVAVTDPADMEIIQGQFRTIEHQLDFDAATPEAHETCVVCRLETLASGSIAVLGTVEATLKMFNSQTPEDTTLDGACPVFDAGVGDDPHVHTMDGRLIDIKLPVGSWVPMLAGPRFAIAARVFGVKGNDDAQWFDGISVLDATTLDPILNATLQHPWHPPSSQNRNESSLAYITATFDGVPVTAVGNYRASDVALTVSKLNGSMTRRGYPDDKLTIATPDFTISLQNSRETNHVFTKDQQRNATHIDLQFLRVPHPQDLAGPLAELIFQAYVASTSAEAAKWTARL